MLRAAKKELCSCTIRQEEQQAEGSPLPWVSKVDKPNLWVLWEERYRSMTCCTADKQPACCQAETSERRAVWILQEARGKVGLTTAIPDNQVPAFLQVDGQQVGKGAGQVTQAVVCFLQSLKRTKESVTHLWKQIINEAGVLPVLQRQSPALSLGQSFTGREKKTKKRENKKRFLSQALLHHASS